MLRTFFSCRAVTQIFANVRRTIIVGPPWEGDVDGGTSELENLHSEAE